MLFAVAATAVAAGVIWNSGGAAHRLQRARPSEPSRLETPSLDERSLTTPPDDTEAVVDNDRGVIRGRLTYRDGSPAGGVPVSLQYAHFKTQTDAAGQYRIDAPAGQHSLYVGLLEIEDFELRAGQQHVADHVIPRGATVSGVVVAAEDGSPLTRGWPRLYGELVSAGSFTRKTGAFQFSWIPNGNYHLVVAGSGPSRRTALIAFAVESTEVDLRVEIPIAPPLPLRFTNLPAEWRESVPFHIEIVDGGGRRHTVPRSNAIGFPGGPESTDFDQAGRAQNAPPTPAPGKYVLKLMDVAWSEPYLEVPFDSPGRDQEVEVRIPDGARVVVSQLHEVITHTSPRLNRLVVGTACERLLPFRQIEFPRVPAGRRAIWKIGSWSSVRLGQVDVPPSGDVMHVIDRDLNAGIRGEGVGDREIQLLHEADDALVAWKLEGSPKFLFSPLCAGRYVLVVDGHRRAVELNARQMIDLGDQLAR